MHARSKLAIQTERSMRMCGWDAPVARVNMGRKFRVNPSRPFRREKRDMYEYNNNTGYLVIIIVIVIVGVIIIPNPVNFPPLLFLFKTTQPLKTSHPVYIYQAPGFEFALQKETAV